MYIYPAIIHKEDGYWIEFPDLEGCQTVGDTLEEVMSQAQEALGLYIASRLENGQDIPAPSDIADIKADDAQTSYVATNVDLYRRNTKAVKKMVSLPEWLAEEADKKSVSLSKVLQDALKAQLNIA